MENNKDNRIYLIIIIILIIIILILLFFTRFGRIDNGLIPTGNVDVFNIDFDCNCNSDSNTDSDCTNIVPSFSENDDLLGSVLVDDINGNFVYQQNLKIFENAAFEYTNKIAPGVFNTYQFVVHNGTDFNIRYYVDMYEDTEYDIDLKYRLRKNGNYIIGDVDNWVSAEELNTEFSNLSYSSSDKYSLDWKWFYDGNDEQDTYVGSRMNSLYKLNIRLYFEQIGE